MPQEFTFGKYKFFEFTMLDKETVRCKVQTESFDVTEEDVEKIRNIISLIGNWEQLVKIGLDLLAEFGIGNPSQNPIKNIEIPFDFELYEVRVNLDRANRCLWVFFDLTREEHQKRSNARINPIIQIEEITNKLANIPKWKNFEETIRTIKKL